MMMLNAIMHASCSHKNKADIAEVALLPSPEEQLCPRRVLRTSTAGLIRKVCRTYQT